MDSASGDIHPNEDDSSSGSGSEHSCPPTPVDSPTDVSHSESKIFVQKMLGCIILSMFHHLFHDAFPFCKIINAIQSVAVCFMTSMWVPATA